MKRFLIVVPAILYGDRSFSVWVIWILSFMDIDFSDLTVNAAGGLINLERIGISKKADSFYCSDPGTDIIL